MIFKACPFERVLMILVLNNLEAAGVAPKTTHDTSIFICGKVQEN